MFKKFMALLALATFIVTPALAQERTFLTNPPTTSGTGVSYNSGTDTVTATAADGARLFSVTRPIERGAKYVYEITVFDYSAGGVQPYVGTTRDTYVAPTVLAPTPASVSLTEAGQIPIQDNFVTANGLASGGSIGPVQTPIDTAVPAFRLFCKTSHFASDDPLVVPNMPGAAHMHNFFGNTGTNAYSTYKSLRTTGGSSCGTDQAHPINRTAYWFPAMLNGRGGIVGASNINVYYKRMGVNQPACNDPVVANRIGICTRVPHGMGMIWGYNMTTMEAAPSYVNSWECRNRIGGTPVGDGTGTVTGPSTGGVKFANLHELRQAGVCPIGATITLSSEAPPCWDGVHLQTPNHRNHVSYRVLGKCPSTHPYYFIEMSHQISWEVDANLNNWRLSSDDQMGMGVVAGSTFHTDVIFAWSPAYKTQWYDGCIDGQVSCSNGANNLGNSIKGNGIVATARTRIVPMTRQGLGVQRKKNGIFKGEFTAPADGEFGLNFLLFTGKVSGFKVTKITKGGRGPVTTTNTQ